MSTFAIQEAKHSPQHSLLNTIAWSICLVCDVVHFGFVSQFRVFTVFYNEFPGNRSISRKLKLLSLAIFMQILSMFHALISKTSQTVLWWHDARISTE